MNLAKLDFFEQYPPAQPKNPSRNTAIPIAKTICPTTYIEIERKHVFGSLRRRKRLWEMAKTGVSRHWQLIWAILGIPLDPWGYPRLNLYIIVCFIKNLTGGHTIRKLLFSSKFTTALSCDPFLRTSKVWSSRNPSASPTRIINRPTTYVHRM